jgi:hypothetical protein
MKNSIITFLFLSLLVTVFSACDHDTDQFDGPNLVDRFGEFQLLEPLMIDRTTVNFSAGEDVRMTALFNKRVNFTVQLTGTESGAVKLITGFDSKLDATNAIWKGGTTELPFFREELVEVELIIPEAGPLNQTGTVEIVGTKVYEGSLFTDFETPPGTNIFFGNFEFELNNNTGRRNDGLAAQGSWYYNFEGTDNVVPNFFAGLIDIKSTITGNAYAPIPTTVPEDLYFNFFLYADGGPHGIAVIQFVYDSNNSGAFEDGQDATFQIAGDYPLNWVGWRQFSHTMADVGMTEEQVSKIVAIRVLLISDMNSQPNPPLQVDFGIDYLTFTAGKALEL